MFDSKDYISYFEDIRQIEMLMIARAEHMKEFLAGNKKAAPLIEHWLHDEKHHKQICQSIEDLIKTKYS